VTVLEVFDRRSNPDFSQFSNVTIVSAQTGPYPVFGWRLGLQFPE